MREDLSRIVAALITNIAVGGKEFTVATCEELNELKEKWPGLTSTEKEEIVAIILSLKTIEEGPTGKSLF